jgi:hypothetical protein
MRKLWVCVIALATLGFLANEAGPDAIKVPQ